MLVSLQSMLIDGLLIFFTSIFFILIVKSNAQKLHLIDIPNNRSSHSTPTPRGAGIAVFLSFFIIILLFHREFLYQYISFFISLFIVFAIGVYDDINNISAKSKLLIISVASLIVFMYGDFQINNIGNWFGYEVTLPYIVSLLFTIFAIVGFTNALNLIDGIDGLAGSISFVILSSLLYIGLIYNDQFIIVTTFFILLSILAFLLFNWYPASIFMGDSGSLVLGFIISIVSIRAINYISDTVILFITAIPIIDTIIVMTRRLQRGVSPFSPDKSHIHHKIINFKKSMDVTVHIIIALQILLSTIGLLLKDKSDAINFSLFLIILFLFFHIFDDRVELRDELFTTKIKRLYIDKIKCVTKCRSIYIVIIILILLFVIRLFF